MFRSSFIRLAVFSITVIVVFTLISCGGDGGSSKATTKSTVTGAQAQLITNISTATNDAERTSALQKVVAAGFSLGVTDTSGKQLNPNVAKDAVSLTTDDVAALSYLVAEQQGRTIGSVVDFLAQFGVRLSSTGSIITFKGLLPDLQKYVNWSFQNSKDPKAALGLFLASGAEMKVPAASPVFTEATIINNTAAVMLISDLILGVKEPVKTSSWWPFGRKAYAADIKETAEKIQGLITIIETGSEFAQGLAGALFGESKPAEQKPKIQIPAIAKQMIAAFAAGNHFSIRIIEVIYWEAPFKNMSSAYSVRTIRLNNVKDKEYPGEAYTALVAMMPSGDVLTSVTVNFTLNLLSPDASLAGQLGPLYPDADAVLFSEWAKDARVQNDGHRLHIAGRLITPEAHFNIKQNNSENKMPKVALLHVTGKIGLPDLDAILKDKGELLRSCGLTQEQIVEFYTAAKIGVEIAPWICKVELRPKIEITLDKNMLEGQSGQNYTFNSQITNLPADWQDYMWKLEWESVGAVTPKVEKKQSATFKWAKAGKYTLVAKVLFVGEKDYEVARVTCPVTINPSLIEINLTITVTGKYSTLETMGFTGSTDGKWPENTEWVYNFNDGSKEWVSASSPSTSYRFTKPGKYAVTFSARNRTTGDVIGQTTREITIDDLNILQTMKFIKIAVYGYKMEVSGSSLNGIFKQLSTFNAYSSVGDNNDSKWDTKWDGRRFTTSMRETNSYGQQSTKKIEAVVSEDTLTIETLTYTYDFLDPNYQGSGKPWTHHRNLILKNIPLPTNRSTAVFYGKVESDKFKEVQIFYEYESTVKDFYAKTGQGDKVDRFVKFDWDNITQGKPYVEVKFSLQ
jgi:hypothetical protein